MERIEKALQKLDVWIERERFQGWDPHDALNSPLLKRLTFGNRWLGIAWVQLVRRSPINLRRLLGVPKLYNPKGLGLCLATYLQKYRMTGDPAYLDRAGFFAGWLQEHISPGYRGACWGYGFDWPNRGFFAPAGTPTIVNTAFIGLAFLAVQRTVDERWPAATEPAAGGLNFQSPLQVARSACEFVLHDLNTIASAEKDEICFSYTPLDRRCVHNANVMGAWLLAEVSGWTGEAYLAETALAAARYTVRRQRPDGAWPYGDRFNDAWVDNFHTGFVLVALKSLARCLETSEFDAAIDAGYAFWKENFFLPDGAPKYYPDKVFPIDAHCVAQAILTFLEFADRDSQARQWAERVASWGISEMQDEEGYFHYQIHRRYRIRIPFLRWSQAWMQRALTELVFQARFPAGAIVA